MKHAGAAIAAVVLAGVAACTRTPDLPPMSQADSMRIVDENLRHRVSVDEFFRTSPDSPFMRDTAVEFRGIQWFPIDSRYCVEAVLHRYPAPETVTILGTRGEARIQQRYGYFAITVPDEDGRPTSLRLNVYRFTPHDSLRYARYRDHLSVWFTDRTTGSETYHVGRYLEIGVEHPDQHHRYTLDLNKAYNPYCAYSDLYSCAIPSDDDRLDIALRVGERTYHD